MSSENSLNNNASHAGLPMPYNIMAGGMSATLFKQDVHRAKIDIKDAKHQRSAFTYNRS